MPFGPHTMDLSNGCPGQGHQYFTRLSRPTIVNSFIEDMVSSLSSKVPAEKYFSGSCIHPLSAQASYINPMSRSRSSSHPSIRPLYYARPRDWVDLATEAVDDVSADTRISTLPRSCIADIHSIRCVPFVHLFPRLLLTLVNPSHCSTKRAVRPRKSDSMSFLEALRSGADSFIFRSRESS